jgi:hypothetical protein
MNKFAIAMLLSAGTLISVQAHASDRAVVGAVDGALVGSYFGGAHGAVAGAIIGAAIGSTSDERYDRRATVRPDYGYVRYAPAPTYYAAPVAYQPYYEPRYEPAYEPQRVVYVQSPVYESYPVYQTYRQPVYINGYASPRRAHYAPQHRYYDYRGRY